MEIRGTTSTGTDIGAATQTGARNSLDKDSFLHLLITQMRYQDPLSPMDNQQFLAQMAQFSSLEQMQNLNDKFEASMALSQSLNNSAAAGLIGRHVRASGDNIRLGESGGIELGYFLQREAAHVTVTVFDEKGDAVRTMVESDASSGAHRFTWDGTDDAGERLAAGSYSFKISAKAEDGTDLSASSLVNGLVSGVTYKNGSAYLLVDGREVSLSEVLEVYQDQP